MADSLTWKAFRDRVLTLLTTDKDRLGIQDTTDAQGNTVPGYLTLTLQAALLDLQDFIESYREGHEDTYGPEAFTGYGKASRGTLPDFAQVKEAYLEHVTTDESGAPITHTFPLNDFAWLNRFHLSTGEVNLFDNNGLISIDDAGEEFIVFPAVTQGYQVRLVWSGYKSQFAEEDQVPFPEEAALAVAHYLKGMIAREVDNDLAKFSSYFHPRDGSYVKERKKLYLAAKNRRSTER